jgi:5-methylcytosine-specific restriction endonuclease McrA
MARRRWINQHPPGTPCSLCGRPVDTTLSGNHPQGPTVEHTVPVRTHPHLALEQHLWRLAHRRCQDRQGALVTNARRRGLPDPAAPPRAPERDW